MKKVMGLVIGLLPVSVSAQCITPPDCASIGYTETSCEGDSLKCPFDTTKLYCPPCDSSYKYTCSGDNIKNPIGDTCNDKYAACECITGATFTNGNCVCDTSCSAGNIYYSDGTCSSCQYSDKTIIGVVVKDNELVMNLNYKTMTWSPEAINIPNLTDFTSLETAITDYTGIENTQTIVDYYGVDGDDTTIAALYCNNYVPDTLASSKGDWYLPAAGELYDYLYLRQDVVSQIKALTNWNQYNTKFHASTEYGNLHSWAINIITGSIEYARCKPNTVNTICFLNISI